MTSYTLSADDVQRIRDALLSRDLFICSGVGDATEPGQGEACTIAEINLVLTGELDDGSHPCISEVIRFWVINVQDAMPSYLRNLPAWRNAAIGIAGSTGSAEQDRARIALIMSWMWEALADDIVIAGLPASVLPAWREMLSQKTANATNAANAAANAADAVAAADACAFISIRMVDPYAADAAYAGVSAVVAAEGLATSTMANPSAAIIAYWERRDPASLLVKLTGVSA
jgi:hypothetical protein